MSGRRRFKASTPVVMLSVTHNPQCVFFAVCRNKLCQHLQPVGVKHFACNVILTCKPQRALLAIHRDQLLQHRHSVGVEHSG